MDEFEITETPSSELLTKIRECKYKSDGWSLVLGAYNCFQNGLDYFQHIMVVDSATQNPIAYISISMTNSLDHSPDGRLFYIGGFYVRPEYRGKGIGKKLFDYAVKKANGDNIALNGAINLTKMYIKKGFVHCRDFKQAIILVPTTDIRCRSFTSEVFTIKHIAQVDFELVAKYDRGISGRDRYKYLNMWLTEPNGTTKIAVDNNSGEVIGVISIHPLEIPRLIVGPLYADTEAIAEQLLHSVLSDIDLSPYTHITFKFPDVGHGLKRILDLMTSNPVEMTVAGICQFTKKICPCDVNRVYSFMETGHSLV